VAPANLEFVVCFVAVFGLICINCNNKIVSTIYRCK